MAIDISSFMREGQQIPSGSALKASQSETILPEWYTNYAMGLLSSQQAQMAQPYTTYQGPRVAEFAPAQQQGFAMTGQAAGAYQPALQQATAATQNLMGQTALSGAQPYFTQAAGMSGLAAAEPSFTQAAGTIAQGKQALGMQAAEPTFQRAEQLSGFGAAQPTLQQALGTTAQGTQAFGMQAAQPYLGAAGQSTVANIGAYMNPFQAAVVDRIGELAQRNLRERFLPEIEGRYIAAGQLGYGGRGGGAGTPSGMTTDAARALRDVQEAALAEQSRALQAGYGEAAGLSAADLARQAQLAATAGGLGTQQQQALLEAAGQQAAIGAQFGQLTQAQQNALTQIASQRGELGTAQQRALLEAASQEAALGAQRGALTQAQQRVLTDIGGQVGQIGGADITRGLAAAEQLGGLGAAAQTLGLKGAEAVTGVGATQQAQAQRNIDVAYENFLRQQGYNQEQINNALATFRGVAGAVPTATQEYGIVPTGEPAQYKPGTAATIGGLLAGAGSILDKAGII